MSYLVTTVEKGGPTEQRDGGSLTTSSFGPKLGEHSDAVLLAIRAAAPTLVELAMRPALDSTARLGLVTLARRTEAPLLGLLRELMAERLRDD